MDDDEATVEEHSSPSPNVRRSLSLMGRRIPNLDLASLIRTSSLTSRRVSAHEAGVRRSRKVTLDYVKQEMLDDIADESTKPDGILNLISHSRSRSGSRSKADEEAQVPVLPASKPPQLLQSRPISSETASTVTAANVTPRKRPPSRIPVPSTVKEEPAPIPAKKNFTIFGIPLPSPRKSSFGSRPTTPSKESSVRAPSPRRAAASPNPKATKQPKPKSELGQGPAPSSSLSKFFVGTGMRVSVSNPEPSRPLSPKTTSSKIPTPRTSQKPTGAHISPSTIVAETTPKAALKTPSRRYMSEVGNTTRVHEPGTPTPAPRVQSSSSMSSVGASTARARMSGASAASAASPTRIRSTISNPRTSIDPRTSATPSTLAPPTPRVRVNSTGAIQPGSQRASAATTTTSTSSLSTRERRPSIDSAHVYRYRPGAKLGGIEEWRADADDEEAAVAPIVTASGSRKGNVSATAHVIKSPSAAAVGTSTTQALAMAATAPKSTISASSRRKHGSFDFERPGWGSRGATSSLGVSSRIKRDREPTRTASVDGRPGTGASSNMAGVGAARVYASTSAAHRTVRVVPPPPPTPPQLEPSHTGASTSTSASQSQATGGTNSWGRSTGKRLSAGFTKLTNGLGLGKSGKSATGAGKERQHGKFAFEPPVPPMPAGIRREQSGDSEQSREREQPQRDWEDRRSAKPKSPLASPKGHAASLSTSSTTSSTHTGVSVGYRSGKKGRSLDLGLGLAWAPTKVREDAVMPESSFGRSLSASRREQQGKEVAEVFRNALDEDGYRSFKKYVHRFDAHEIPFDGPTGIVTRVERLLRKAQHLGDDARQELLDSFIKLILQNA
ncbi:hypothetical protein C8R45DRAFT_285682 [Mycena sanguinolenta]|nr:hypothetical protein C8R45DRAFT_285682 [Mycena sanguinolenta]